ncbi:unnamed protein product [Ilex paraguariensis]|uniref:WAT1-related protein n=1 Tax=Ilex paraguariensis TaxID=185542 RepID=A0ABC8R0F7_9AQUA
MDNNHFFNRAKPYLAVIFLQFGYAGTAIIAKSALNQGMSHYTFAVYRNAIATAVFAPFAIILERKVRPRMTTSIFLKIMLIGLLEYILNLYLSSHGSQYKYNSVSLTKTLHRPVIDQNLYYTGLKYTTATFASAMGNILPALTFLMAWILSGAMIMTLIEGPSVRFPWTKHKIHEQSTSATNQQDSIKGALMIMSGCFCWACFYILQGIISSGVMYYVSGTIVKEKGPVFVTVFNPLSMVIIAIMGSFIFAEQMDLGKVLGAVTIVAGLYMVIWGKSKDQSVSKSEESISKSDGDWITPIDQQLNTRTMVRGLHVMSLLMVLTQYLPMKLFEGIVLKMLTTYLSNEKHGSIMVSRIAN